MIALKYSDLNNDHLFLAFKKLCGLPNLPMKEAYNISKINKWLHKETDQAKELFAALQKKNDELFKEVDATPDEEEKKAKHAINLVAAKASLTSFMEFTVELERSLIAYESAEKAGLTPYELDAVWNLLAPEVEKGPKSPLELVKG